MNELTDADLEAMLAGAAAEAPAPEEGVPKLGEGSGRTTATLPIRRHTRRWLPAAAAVAAALAIGSVVVNRQADDADMAAEVAEPVVTATTIAPPGDEGLKNLESADSQPVPNAAAAPARGASGGGLAGAPAPAPVPTPAPAPLADSAKIVKTGSVEVEVGQGGFSDAVTRVSTLAAGLSGYVSANQTTEQGEAPKGTITVRVPVDSFDKLLEEVRRLGTVQAAATSGTDVTAQFVDLEARLGALTATRDQLLTVLTQAESIPDILAIQDRINAVQVEIESLKGQQNVLVDQSSLGTLTVTLSEPGAEEPTPLGQRDDGGLSGAWQDAQDGFGNTLEWIVARSGKGVVMVAIGLLAYSVGMFAVRRYRRAAL